MTDLFHSYWWLLFPIGWFVYSGWASWLNYRRQRETLEVVRRYAEQGKEVPPELMKVLDRPIDSETEFWNGNSWKGGSSDTASGHAYSLVLFAALAAGFGYAGWSDFYGAGDAFVIVAIVMGALALASLAAVIFSIGRRR